MNALRWIDKHLEEVLMSAAIIGIAVVMGAQVFMRYLLHSSIPWAEEICRYFFIWFAFLGLSYATSNDLHLRIDLLVNFFPKIKRVLDLFSDLVLFIFCFYMLRAGGDIIIQTGRSGQLSPALRLPMVVVYSSLMVGLVLSLLRLAQKYARRLTARRGRGAEEP